MNNDIDNLPKGWAWTQLGEIALEPQYGWTTSAVDTGKLRLLRTSDITSGRVDWTSVPFCQDEPPNVAKYLLHDGDIVISRAGSVGYSYLVKNAPQAVFASYLIRFKPLIDAAYFDLFLKSPMYWEAILEKTIGIALANVNASKLKQITVPLPPLPEQQRVVVKIEELFTRLDAGVEALNKIKSQLKRYRQSVLKHAFEGKLTAEWRQAHKDELQPASVLLERIKQERQKIAKGKYKELPQLDTSELTDLPEGWVWAQISAIAESMKNGIYKPASYYSDNGIACLRMYNIENGFIIWKDIKRMNLSKNEISEYQLLPGDVLVNRVNSRELVGKAAVIPTGLEPCVYESKNIRLRLYLRYVNSTYVNFWFLLSSQEYFNRNAQQTVGMASINQEQLGSMPIPIPQTLEQHRIVEEVERRFSVADQIEKTVDHSLKQAERLRHSILKRAFEGKLVPQDPNDEPAEKLLERIKAERTKRLAEAKATSASKKKITTKQMRLV